MTWEREARYAVHVVLVLGALVGIGALAWAHTLDPQGASDCRDAAMMAIAGLGCLAIPALVYGTFLLTRIVGDERRPPGP